MKKTKVDWCQTKFFKHGVHDVIKLENKVFESLL